MEFKILWNELQRWFVERSSDSYYPTLVTWLQALFRDQIVMEDKPVYTKPKDYTNIWRAL